ncbi:hypothetical protein [Massilia sp.]|uniref:hypothetical protein n=1 Tax=Massilia sp. TaxID=1882437 RepID=UPI00352E077E
MPEHRHLFQRKLRHDHAIKVDVSPFTTQRMKPAEWIDKCERWLTNPQFETFVLDQLKTIRTAPTASDRARYAGSFGGFLRSARSSARLELAEAMMKELAVETTQHVAFMLMKKAFGQAAKTATLDRFAKSGRDASEKHMSEACAAAADKEHLVERYGGMYAWYIKRLALQIARIKRKDSRSQRTKSR